ncbi:MAG: hypothetical protein HQL91_08175 [Magnetococcales bacterium]|nr:hypothetical protein [Magnetococcales bacterium]
MAGATTTTGGTVPDQTLALRSAVVAAGVDDPPLGNIQRVVDAYIKAISAGKDVESVAAAGRAADAGDPETGVKNLTLDVAKVIAAGGIKAADETATAADVGTAAENMARVLMLRDEAVNYASENFKPTAGEKLVVPEWLINPANKFPPEPLVDITGETVPEDPTLAFDYYTNRLDGAKAAARMLAVIGGAIDRVSSTRAELGAVQNRFEANIANLSNVVENVSAARSRIMDADIAAETANLTKLSIMQQAGTAILAQANQQPQLALQLLR